MNRKGKIRKTLRWHVKPRYTPGSPAMVSQQIAEQVLEEERRSHAQALTGSYGPEAKQEAESLGLAGIVWTTLEQRSVMIKQDLLTHTISSQRILRDGSLEPESTA